MSNDTAAPEALTLYTYFRSSAAFRVRIALNLKGLKPEQRFVHLLRHEQSDEAYRRLNPQAVVPTLVHDGHALGQSLAIIEYLDEIVPRPALLPADPYPRANVRQIAQAIACEIHPLCNLRVREYLRDGLKLDDDALAQWQRHWIGLRISIPTRSIKSGRNALAAPSVWYITWTPYERANSAILT